MKSLSRRLSACVGGLILLAFVNAARAQEPAIAPVPSSAPAVVRPYLAPDVPPARLGNSDRLRRLVRAGHLYLTVQDAIALALENNIDIEVARYNPILAEWRVTRAEAGGLLPGVPSNAAQAGAVAIGQGVQGSQAAAGVRVLGGGQAANQSANVTISQIGPVTQTLDPTFQEASTFSHTTNPQPNVVLALTPVLVSGTRAHTGTFQQGLLSGGSVSGRYAGNFLDENSPTDVLNPSSAANLSISAQHNLLRGFGAAVNARTISVAKANVNISDLGFQTRVIGVVTQVLNVYYGLSAGAEDIRAKQNALDTAEKFFADVKEQVRIGSVAPPELINAESQVVSSRRALVDAQATQEQQEIQMKNLISRRGTGDPELSGARIVTLDSIVIPDNDGLPPVGDMVKQARANRTDLEAERQSEAAAEISNLGTRNGILPTAQVFGAESQAGLAGTGRTVITGRTTEAPNPYFVGGVGTALGQVFRRNFPTERIGAFYAASLRNRQAQADFGIDQLQFRQTQLTTRKDLNQVEVDVVNAVVALRQSRARYDAAVKNRVLQEELFAAEQKRFALGASIPYNVILQQRNLVTAQSAEVASRVAYINARIALDRTLGATLATYHISISEAREGKVERKSEPPLLPR